MEDAPVTAASGLRLPRRTVLHWLCWIMILTGVLLQLTVRDRIPFPVAGLYYALPRPILLMLSLLAAILAGPGWRRRVWHGVVVLLLIGWVGWCDVAWRTPGAARPGAKTVIFWNVGRNLFDDAAVVDGFLETSPAIVGLVETGELSAEWLAAWQASWPEYEFVVPHPGCLLIVRGQVRESGYERLGFDSHAVWVDADWEETTVRAVLVDIAANPWIDRRAPLERLSAQFTQWNDGPRVVMGDFNTPEGSVWFAGMRRDFRDVFETAGSGYGPTWPWPLPVLKLDQMWISQEFHAVRSGRYTTWRSDHRPVWAELDLTAASSGPHVGN